MSKNITQRFWEKVNTTGNCWEWAAYKDKDNYGVFWFRNQNWKAHRVIWTSINGEIPEDMCVLHHCDNPPCVKLEHLFLGTNLDNSKDRDRKGRNGHAKKTHCPQGHPYSGENLYIVSNKNRRCRVCHNKRLKEHYKQTKGRKNNESSTRRCNGRDS